MESLVSKRISDAEATRCELSVRPFTILLTGLIMILRMLMVTAIKRTKLRIVKAMHESMRADFKFCKTNLGVRKTSTEPSFSAPFTISVRLAIKSPSIFS